MLTLTESAQAAVKNFIDSSDKEYLGLRIGVDGGGCSGYTYALRLEEFEGANDIHIQAGEVTVLMDLEHAPVLEGTIVDFIDNVEGKGFKFENPNAQDSCGCGKSFSAGTCSTPGATPSSHAG
ncbi:MAG: HesB/IscA family protein [Magnetovibrionaceae bacterium]